MTWCNVIFRETIQTFCFLLSFLTLVLLIHVLLFAHVSCSIKTQFTLHVKKETIIVFLFFSFCYEKLQLAIRKKFHNLHYHSEQVCEIIISSNDKQRKGIKAFTFNQLCNCLIESHVLNPLSPSNIHIQILHTEIFTFP